MKQLNAFFFLLLALAWVLPLSAQDVGLGDEFGGDGGSGIEQDLEMSYGKVTPSFSKLPEKSGDIIELKMKFTLKENEYLYSALHEAPNMTRFTFDGHGYELYGLIKQPEIDESEYGDDYEYHKIKGHPEFVRQIKITDIDNFKLIVRAQAQICYQQCFDHFSQWTSSQDGKFIAFKKDVKSTIQPAKKVNSLAAEGNKDLEKIKGSKGGEKEKKPEEQSFFGLVWAGIIGGIFAMLTPCVFPMIPITISYFLKQAGDDRSKTIRLATVYCIGIVVIFTALGLIITAVFGEEGINIMATNAWVNLFIGIVFFLFALSFFGAFEIRPPAWVQNKAFSASQGGGYIGALFMGFAFAVTSFTCTAPIVSTQLGFAAQTGNYYAPTVVMLAFSGVIALVFFVLAMFPSALKSMPKSGGWLGDVKIVLGFIELALAFKFFRVSDLAWKWEFLSHDMVLMFWLVISAVTALFLFGFIKIGHGGSGSEGMSVTRLFVALCFSIFTVYLYFGLTGSKLNANIESFLLKDDNFGNGYKGWVVSRKSLGSGDKNKNLLPWMNDYLKALDVAKKEKKNIMINYSGKA